MNSRIHTRSGFTLLEVMVAAILMMLALALSLSGFLYAARNQSQADVQTQLNMDTRKAIERLKSDLRLSSLNEMFFYPSTAGVYEAISFPLAYDSDGDGAVEVNMETRRIIWDRTVIYHVWPSLPNELRVTSFQPRNTNASDSARQAQLDRVVLDGNGNSARLTGESTTTFRIFRNLFTWQITPRSSTFDGYAAETTRVENVSLGSCILAGGPHDFTLRVAGKNSRNTSSTGYRIVLDTLKVSPCPFPREAELQTSALISNVPTTIKPESLESTILSWSEKNFLNFNAATTNAEFTLRLNSDRWEESQFYSAGDKSADVVTVYDESVSPHNYVLQLDGNTTNWSAAIQTLDQTGSSLSGEAFNGAVVRVLLRGRSMEGAGRFTSSGAKCRVGFKSGSGLLKIEEAWISRCASNQTACPDAVPTSQVQLKFGGSASVAMLAGTTVESDLASFSIEREESYLVTFRINQWPILSNPYEWADTLGLPTPSSYVIRSPTSTVTAQAEQWSTFDGVTPTNRILAVSHVYCTYAPTGVYQSAVCDTMLASPVYQTWTWSNAVPVPIGASQIIAVRSANNEDMSDAPAWSNIVSTSVLDSKRYVQFQVTMTPSSDTLSTPKLALVSIPWQGQNHVVDVGGTFGKGPDHGIWTLTVDGNPLKSGIQVDLQLYKDIRGFKKKGSQLLTSYASTEVMPRNTGK
jgi:type II secretory pathway pseudopilin PulG